MDQSGLFGPGSVTWRVMAEPVLFVGGFRALLMQGLHPRAMRGVIQNSALLDPAEAWGRFLRTTEFVRVRTYGTADEVEQAAARVRKIHATLTAYDPDVGDRYHLDEPDALRWVHVGEVDSYLSTARRAGIPSRIGKPIGSCTNGASPPRSSACHPTTCPIRWAS